MEGFDINNVVVVEEGGSVGGWMEWHNVPAGTHKVSTVTKVKDVVLETWNFCVKLECLLKNEKSMVLTYIL